MERSAAQSRQAAMEANALTGWARNHGHIAVLQALADGKTKTLVDAVRSAVFDLLADIPRFRKMAKTDLLIANPTLRAEAGGLYVSFEAADDQARGEAEQRIIGTIVERLMSVEVPN